MGSGGRGACGCGSRAAGKERGRGRTMGTGGLSVWSRPTAGWGEVLGADRRAAASREGSRRAEQAGALGDAQGRPCWGRGGWHWVRK